MKNIILCGFMGCGKSTVGTALAKLLSRDFIDMDSFIEARENMKIPEIFEKNGEEYFRSSEYNAIVALSGMQNLVIASGGGALQRRENVDAMRQNGDIVFLNASFDVCYSRIKDSDRPLVKKLSREELERIYNERAPVYREAASITADCTDNPDETAKIIATAASFRTHLTRRQDRI